jgi:uncharacterized protein YjiS (DUF1127 family)
MMSNFLTAKFRRWSMYRQASRELSSLSGRELADMGISRSDIPRIARQAAGLN